jgi:hypothetical protein
MKKNKLLIIIILLGFLTFGMSYSSFVKENVVAPIIKQIAGSEKRAIDQVAKSKTESKKSPTKKIATDNSVAAAAITLGNTVTVNGGGNAVPGSQLDFTITIANNGTDDALGTTFQDILDSNLTLVPGSLKAAPIAADDTYNCIGNVGITLNAAQGVLTNDISPDGTAITVTAFTGSTPHGTLSLTSNGSFTYNPTAGYSGPDSFTYTLTSGSGKTNTGILNITVSAPIYFVDSSVGTSGNGTLASPFKAVENVPVASSGSIFIYTGTGSSGTTLTLSDNQKLIGQGATASLTSILGITVPTYSNTLPSTGGTSPNFSILNLKLNNDVEGITLNGSNATMAGTSVGALKVRNVTISGGSAVALNIGAGGILDCIFKSISASGGSKGISISNSTGSVQVTGTGTISGSGGTIANIINRGAEFTSCTNITLKNMNFLNSNLSGVCNTPAADNSLCNNAIHLKTVTGVTLDNIRITGINNAIGININNVNNFTLSNSTLTGCGSNSTNSEVGGIYALNLGGTSAITNTIVNDSWGRGFYAYNGILSTNPTLNLTITGCQFKNSFNRENGGSNFIFQGYGTSNNTLVLKGNDFSNAKEYGLTLNFGGDSTNNIQVGGNSQSEGNIINAAISSPGSNGLSLQAVGDATVNYNVIYNTLKSSFTGSFTCNIGNQGTRTMKGRINNNIIDGGGIGSSCNGISVAAYGSGKHITEILDNTITNITNYGIVSEANDNLTMGTARMDATIKNNIISLVSNANAYAHVAVISIGNDPGSTLQSAANIGKNTTNSPVVGLAAATFDILALGTNSQVILQGPTTAYVNGTGDRTTALTAYWNANNTPEVRTALDEQGGGTIVSGAVFVPDNASTSKFATTPKKTVEELTPITSTQNTNDSTNNQSAKISSAKVAAETISVGPFTLPGTKNTTVTFSATINAANVLPPSTCQVTNQATVSGSNFTTVNSNITTTSIKPVNATFTNSTQNIACLGSTTVNLNATCPLGTTPTWYSTLNGGTSFATGESVTATPTTNNTTYCVACEATYCASDRLLVKTVTGTASTASTQTISACDTYRWAENGITYTTSGTYTNMVGCDTKTLNLTITNSTSSTPEIVSKCDTYTWPVNGTTYTTSGTYTYVNGCNTKTLNLTITNSTSSTPEIVSKCDTYTWPVNSTTYTTSGTYTYVNGCNTKTLNLTITNSTTSTPEIVSKCDTYTWPVNGTTYTTSGTYTYVNGCNTKTLNLTITNSTSSTPEIVSKCDTYTWPVNGITYTTSGTYTNVVGCDTKTLNLTIKNSTSSTQTVATCDNYTWAENGATYTTSGVYTKVVGCDTKTLNLTITNSTSSSQTVAACDTYTWPVNGTTYTTSGVYTKVVGCDTKTLNLTITNSTSSTPEIVSKCDTYTWPVNGTTYTTSGTYTYVNGCNTKTLNLTITNSTSSTQTVVACDTYTWAENGTTYTTSGVYTKVVGCDTKTLNLIINNSTSSTQTVAACGTYIWSENGTTYTASGVYTKVVGCDTKTLNLTINNSTSSTKTVTTCDTYTWAENGTTYTTSGVYTKVVGCDTKTLNLTINNSTSSTQTVVACDTYTWAENGTTYTASGVYTNVVGCDTNTLNLTINNSSAINASVNLNSGIITSNHLGATYQWYKCPNTLLVNEKNQSYTPLTNGDYKVEITIADCTISSNCITVNSLAVGEFKQNEFKIYPNPSKGTVNIVTPYKGNYIIIDQSGKIIKSFNLEGNIVNTLNLENVSEGIYFIESTSDNKIKAKKLIIKK